MYHEFYQVLLFLFFPNHGFKDVPLQKHREGLRLEGASCDQVAFLLLRPYLLMPGIALPSAGLNFMRFPLSEFSSLDHSTTLRGISDSSLCCLYTWWGYVLSHHPDHQWRRWPVAANHHPPTGCCTTGHHLWAQQFSAHLLSAHSAHSSSTSLWQSLLCVH